MSDCVPKSGGWLIGMQCEPLRRPRRPNTKGLIGAGVLGKRSFLELNALFSDIKLVAVVALAKIRDFVVHREEFVETAFGLEVSGP